MYMMPPLDSVMLARGAPYVEDAPLLALRARASRDVVLFLRDVFARFF